MKEKLRGKIANFLPIFKNSLCSQNDTAETTKKYAEDEGIKSQPRKMLVSSFTLQEATPITPVHLSHQKLGFLNKITRFVEYTAKKCLNILVKSAIEAGRQSDENPDSCRRKDKVAKSSHGYKFMDHRLHTVTKYLNDEETCCYY